MIDSKKQNAGYIFTNRDLHGAIGQRAETLRTAYDACMETEIFDEA